MHTLNRILPGTPTLRVAAAVLMVLLAAGCMRAVHHGQRHDARQTLTGANEVPPNSSTATGLGTVRIGRDGTVSGSIAVTGMLATAAHIHEGPPGQNGPVIVPFVMTGNNTFIPVEGARLSEAQMASYRAGNLYINAHSAAYPGGEIRAQLTAQER